MTAPLYLLNLKENDNLQARLEDALRRAHLTIFLTVRGTCLVLSQKGRDPMSITKYRALNAAKEENKHPMPINFRIFDSYLG